MERYSKEYSDFLHGTLASARTEIPCADIQGHFHEPGASSEKELHAEHQPQNAIEAEAEHR